MSKRARDEEDNDGGVEGENGNDDGQGSSEIPLYARFLSHVCYSHKICGDNWMVVLGSDLWNQYLSFCKRNHHKVKTNATQFARDLQEFSALSEESGVRKYRENDHLVFALHSLKIQSCLESHGMLDLDVW